MLSKTFAFVAGTAGYLLGRRADRRRFDLIKEQAARIQGDSVGGDPRQRDRPRSRA